MPTNRRESILSWKSAKSYLFRRSSSIIQSKFNEQDAIYRIRDMVLSRMYESPEKFDHRDQNRIKSDNWSISRYFEKDFAKSFDHDSCSKVTDAICRTMEWRKKIRLNDLTFSDFPKFIYEQAGYSLYLTPNGSLVSITEIAKFRSIPEIHDVFESQLNHWHDVIDDEYKSHGMCKYCSQFDHKFKIIRDFYSVSVSFES